MIWLIITFGTLLMLSLPRRLYSDPGSKELPVMVFKFYLNFIYCGTEFNSDFRNLF